MSTYDAVTMLLMDMWIAIAAVLTVVWCKIWGRR